MFYSSFFFNVRKRKKVIIETPQSPREKSEQSDQEELTPFSTSDSGETSVDGESDEDVLLQKKTKKKAPVDVKRIVDVSTCIYISNLP